MNTQIFQLFQFKKPVEIESHPDGDEVVVFNDKIIIKMDKDAEDKDLAEILAKAKLGENDPLLATFYFQPDMTEAESGYATAFFNLCLPLQSAWTYRTMRTYAPVIYVKEIAELMAMYDFMTKDKTSPVKDWRLHLSMYCILAENPANTVNIGISYAEGTYRGTWERYINTRDGLN